MLLPSLLGPAAAAAARLCNPSRTSVPGESARIFWVGLGLMLLADRASSRLQDIMDGAKKTAGHSYKVEKVDFQNTATYLELNSLCVVGNFWFEQQVSMRECSGWVWWQPYAVVLSVSSPC